MTALERAREALELLNWDWSTGDYLQLRPLLTNVVAALETHEGMGDHTPAQQTMSRVDALKMAREHVEAMATNSRGYQDGVKLSDKVQAMDAFARFLMGE